MFMYNTSGLKHKGKYFQYLPNLKTRQNKTNPGLRKTLAVSISWSGENVRIFHFTGYIENSSSEETMCCCFSIVFFFFLKAIPSTSHTWYMQ